MTPHLRTVVAGPGADPGPLLAALADALDGGPAVLPVPLDPAGRTRLEAAMRPDLPPDRTDGRRAAAVVVPTSGSTGPPKGALLSARALRASAGATLDRLGGPGGWLLALPTTHVAGVQVLVRSLLAGTPPVALDLAGGFRPEAFAAAAAGVHAARRYTALVPTQLVRVLDAGGGCVDALASFDAVLLGGAAAPADLVRRARAAGVRVVTTYGMSETCGGCVYDGVPLSAATVRVDPDGLVCVTGEVLFDGYRLRPDLTAGALVGGQYRTADIGRFTADGRLEVLGRADDMIVTGGEKVAPAAVEAVLLADPSVREAVVVGVPDTEWGQRVAALVVPVDGATPDPVALSGRVAAALGRPAAPRRIELVAELPRLALGKLDRVAAARLAAE